MNLHATAVLGFGAAALMAHAALMRARARRRARHVGAGHAPSSDRPPVSPTFLFIYALALAALLETVVPLAPRPERPLVWLAVGLAVAAAAEGLMQSASRALKRHATTEDALEAAAVIVAEGPFARSRNPIYAGMLLLFCGLAVAAASLWGALLLPALFLLLDVAIVRPEERVLSRRFGAVYQAYRERVPRYL